MNWVVYINYFRVSRSAGVIFVFLFAVAPALAIDFSFQSKLEQSYFQTHKDSQDPVLVNRSTASTQLNLQLGSLKIGDFQIFAEPRLDWNWRSSYLAKDQIENPLWDLRQGYWQFSNESFKFTLGKFLVSWGSSDVLNPTDFFGITDQSRLAVDSEDNRMGVNGARLKHQYSISESKSWQTEIVLAGSPLKNKTKSTLDLSATPSVELGSTLYDKTIVNMGAKTGYFADNWDISAVVFHGQNKTPELQIIESSLLGTKLADVHQNMTGFGLDVNWVLKKWILRGEMAYETATLIEGIRELESDDLFYGVYGLERPIGNHYRFHFQFYAKHQLNYNAMNANSAAPLDQLKYKIRQYNNKIRGFQGDADQGFFLRGSGQFMDDRLEMQIVTISSVTNSTHIIRPSIKWTSSANYILEGGSVSYIGADDTPVGALRNDSHFFLQAQYLF